MHVNFDSESARGYWIQASRVVVTLPARFDPALLAHLLTGLAVGLVFGGLLLVLDGANVSSGVALLTWVVNELLFPAGCAAIVFVGNALATRAAS